MMTIAAPLYLWLIFAGCVFMIGAILGQWDTKRAYRRREQQRHDEASQFDLGMKITMGDGSYIVVRSEAPGKPEEKPR